MSFILPLQVLLLLPALQNLLRAPLLLPALQNLLRAPRCFCRGASIRRSSSFLLTVAFVFLNQSGSLSMYSSVRHCLFPQAKGVLYDLPPGREAGAKG